eukprot:symbB.v1.2.036025.t1/scaffold4988.1/size32064/3
MGKWECSKCLEDNSDSEELCQWCDTLRDEADPVRIRAQSQRRDGSPELQTKPENSDSNGCVEAAWALRRQRLLKELAEVDWCAPEERRSRLRALQLELHPDKHQQGQQQFAQEMFLLVQSRWEEDERSRRRRQEEAMRAEEREKEKKKRAEAARAKEEALRRQKEAEEAEQKRRLDAAMAAAREEDARRQRAEEEAWQRQEAREDEGIQLDEDESEEVSISDCITEQHLVESNRRKQEEQLRTELRTKKEEEEETVMWMTFNPWLTWCLLVH